MSKCKYCNAELSAPCTASISNKALIPSDIYHVDLCNDCAKAVVNALQLLERLIPKDSAKNELKPCPFCGGKAQLVAVKETYDGIRKVEISGWRVRCNDCKAETTLEVREVAVNKWNRRAENGI